MYILIRSEIGRIEFDSDKIFEFEFVYCQTRSNGTQVSSLCARGEKVISRRFQSQKLKTSRFKFGLQTIGKPLNRCPNWEAALFVAGAVDFIAAIFFRVLLSSFLDMCCNKLCYCVLLCVYCVAFFVYIVYIMCVVCNVKCKLMIWSKNAKNSYGMTCLLNETGG